MKINRVEISCMQTKPSEPSVEDEVCKSQLADPCTSKAAFRRFAAETPKLQFAKKGPSEKNAAGSLQDVLMNIDPHVLVHKGILKECTEEDGFLLSVPRKRRFRWRS